METITLDLNDLAEGGLTLATFPQTVDKLDLASYQGKKVQIKGCAPTWAHLVVAGKLFSVAEEVEFLIDDKKGGRPVSVFKKQ